MYNNAVRILVLRACSLPEILTMGELAVVLKAAIIVKPK